MTAALPSLAIPFHRPALGPAERAAVIEVLDSGWLTTGERSVRFEEAVAARLGVRHAVAVNSATAALHLALEALHLGPGDEVIVPAYTFASSGEVVRYLGARPRIADVDARTLALTPETIEAQVEG
ncbi:MAG: DegT/DnrJ/EryC1/StrS aminotransferase family protein, partial [Chloroflexota bacterium]